MSYLQQNKGVIDSKDFTGDAEFLNLSGRLISGFRLKDGKIAFQLKPAVTSARVSVNAVAETTTEGLVTLEDVYVYSNSSGWTYMSVYSFNASMGVYNYTGCNNCTTPPIYSYSGGGSPPQPTPPSPCSTASTQRGQSATNTFHIPVFVTGENLIASNIKTATNEMSVSFGTNNNTGLYATTPVLTSGNAGNTGIYSSYSGMTITASAHTHTPGLFDIPSAGDIYAIATGNKSNSNYISSYVIGSDGSTYALVVNDPAKLAAFTSLYPASTFLDTDDWNHNNNNAIALDYQDVYNQVNPTNQAGALDIAAYERAQAYILDTYNTGVSLLKEDASGNFHEIHTVKNVTQTSSTPTYDLVPCN